MADQNRFQDPGASVGSFADEFIVACPRCQHQARVVAAGPQGDARATCQHCGFARSAREGPGFGGPVYTGPADPFFGLPLWLQSRCCGETLWAWNAGHLRFLAGLVGADLRERPRQEPVSGDRNRLLASRLPRWILSARNRDEVRRSLARLSERLQAPGDD